MRIAIPISLIGALLFTGCAARHAELAVNNPRPVAAGNYETVYHAAIDVLRERGFDINRKDHRFGVITTHPRGAPTL
ncbi:MAG: hypothetical protein MI741_13265, partial [Rhodospirillales bacterium]|nr:hypothetical protein [Rhodospirillales bacterium]